MIDGLSDNCSMDYSCTQDTKVFEHKKSGTNEKLLSKILIQHLRKCVEFKKNEHVEGMLKIIMKYT